MSVLSHTVFRDVVLMVFGFGIFKTEHCVKSFLAFECTVFAGQLSDMTVVTYMSYMKE